MLLRRQLLLDALRACVTACNEYFSGSLNGPAVAARVRGIRLYRACADESSQYSEAHSGRCTKACRQAEDAGHMAY